VDFAGENRGGIYLDAVLRGFFCGKMFVVVKWLNLAGVLRFVVRSGW
jgi:hypothetical protein